MISWVAGIAFGFTLQLGVGPVNLATWFIGVEKGWRSSLQVACGVALVDFLYITLAYILKDKVFAGAVGWVSLIAALFLFYMAFQAFRSPSTGESAVIKGNLFIFGFLLNVLNPKAILLWVSLIAVLDTDYGFVAGIPVSTVVWLGLVPLLFNLLRMEKALGVLLRYKHLVLGGVFLLYGVLGIANAYSLLWG